MNRDLYYDLVKWVEERVESKDEWRRKTILNLGKHFELEGTILYRKQNNSLLTVIHEGKTKEILRLAHDHSLSGHMGQDNTYFRLKNNVWWPGMKQDIINYVRACDIGQKRKKNRNTPLANSATIRAEPFSHIRIDVMGPLPRTLTGKRYIILAVDFFTKYIEVTAVEDADAQTVTKFIHSDIICRHGVPKEITSDRGTEFLNDLVVEMERTYHIKHIKTTAYHPQGNGQTERSNQTIKNILSKVCKQYDSWDYYLDSALFAARTIRQQSTKFSPFELVYGQAPEREFYRNKPDIGSYEERLWAYITRDISRLQLIRRKAKVFIEKAQERQRTNQNKKVQSETLYIGDSVLLYRDI